MAALPLDAGQMDALPLDAGRSGASKQYFFKQKVMAFRNQFKSLHMDLRKCIRVAHELSTIRPRKAAFDCMPPNLMYHKLLAYGFSKNSALLIHNYLSNHSQRVKIGDVVGEWMDLAKGTPKGSKLGPALFNLFINDLLLSLPEGSVVNFADDNTLYAIDSSPRALNSKIKNRVNQAQTWFREWHAVKSS